MGEMIFSKELFPDTAVRGACKAFQKLAQLSVKETPVEWSITYSDSVCDEDRLEKEFNNYLIDLTCKLKAW